MHLPFKDPFAKLHMTFLIISHQPEGRHMAPSSFKGVGKCCLHFGHPFSQLKIRGFITKENENKAFEDT